MAIIALGWGERPNKKGVTGRVTGVLTLGLELRPGPLMYPWEIPVGGITSGLLPVTKGKLLRKLSPFLRGLTRLAVAVMGGCAGAATCR